jgi:glucokinase
MAQAADSSVVATAQTAAAPFLAADVGGTHARVGLVRADPGHGGVAVLAYHKYVCADYAGLDAIIREFVRDHGDEPVRRCALACAGYVIDGAVINDNLPWKVSIPALRASLHLDELALLNDFEAVAWATQYLDPHEGMSLSPAAGAAREGAQVVVGPGTGLGSAVLLPLPGGRRMVLATEAGQIALAPGNELEADIWRVLARQGNHVSCEHALSGPGLHNLYQALCRFEGATPRLASPEAVTDAARREGDPLACQALDTFCAMMGSFCGDLAMLYGAAGGIWLAGGILPKIRDFLVHSTFVERFLDKGRMRAFLERVPVRLMEHGRLGVVGAAGWYLDRQARASAAPTRAATTGERSAVASDSNRGVRTTHEARPFQPPPEGRQP